MLSMGFSVLAGEQAFPFDKRMDKMGTVIKPDSRGDFLQTELAFGQPHFCFFDSVSDQIFPERPAVFLPNAELVILENQAKLFTEPVQRISCQFPEHTHFFADSETPFSDGGCLMPHDEIVY